MRPGLWTVCDAALFAAGLWLVAATPVPFIGGSYDDLLFVRQANALLDGHWLGAFDQLTLSKGCFYPLFLAAMAKLHAPVLAATQAVYLSAALLFSRIGATRPAATLRFALLALSPVPLDGACALLMREPLYAALTLAALASTARRLLPAQARWPWGVVCGATLAAFWLTREEGVWLVPALCVLLAGALLRGRQEKKKLGPPPAPPAKSCWGVGGEWLHSTQSFLLPAAFFSVCLLAIAATNQTAYGVFRTNDFQQGPFSAAYGALSRIDHATWQRFIPVPRDARAKAYAVSGAARELQPFLEGEPGRGWIAIGCQSNPIADCQDFQSGWFIWALRDATTRAGHYGSAQEADRFYRRLAKEIDAACDKRKLACLKPPHGYLPPLQHIDIGKILQDAMALAGSMAAIGPPNPHGLPSLVQGADAAPYRRVTPNTQAAAAFSFDAYPGWMISARIDSADRDIDLSVPPEPGGLARSSLHREGGVLSGEIRCAPGACALQAMRDGRPIAAWPVISLVQGEVLSVPGLRITLDRVVPLPVTPPPPPTLQEKAAGFLSHAVPPISRIAFPLSLAWTAWSCLRDVRRRRIEASTILAAATATAIGCRIALLAVLDATSIPVQFRYELPGMILVPALIGLMLAGFLPKRRVP